MTDTLWLTPAALAALKDELAGLTGAARAEAEGDAARIAELRDLIARAEAGAKPDDGLVEAGMTVTVRFAGDDEALTFLFGSRELVRHDAALELEVYSPQSPLGRAIDGHYPGDTVEYTAPNGRPVRVEILSAVPFV